MRIRAEYAIALLLLLGGGVALALSLAGDDEPEGKRSAEAAPPQAGVTPAQDDTVAPEARKITVRVDGERKTVRAGLIRTPFCRTRLELCAAITGRKAAGLTPAQRRVVKRARATLRRQRAEQRRREREQAEPPAAPTPTPAPVPEPAPAPPAPEPEPQPQEQTTTG